MSDGRKIEENIDNPIDNILLSITEKVAPELVNLGFTPNIITTFSLISGLLGIYYIYKEQYVYGSLFFFLGYFFDCVDGYMARKFDLITKFGDLYDHITDWVVSVLLILVYFTRDLNTKFKITILIFFSIFTLLSLVHLGCQEKYYEEKENSQLGVLSGLKMLCPNKENIKTTRYFGLGTLTLAISLVIIFTPQLNILFRKL